MKRLSLIIPAGIMTLAFVACGDDSHISQGKMADILADLQLAEAYASNNVEYASDSAKNVLRLTVLKKHGVTQAELDSTLTWYAHNLENYTKLYTEVDKRLEKRQDKLLSSSSSSADNDATSIWPYSHMAMLSPLSAQDAITFSVPVSDFAAGERITWMMRLSEMVPTQMMLGVDYTDGTSSYTMRRNSQKRLEMSLQSDSARTVSRIYGMMRIENRGALPVWADSITLRHLPLAKETYHIIHQQMDYRGPRRNAAPDTARRRPTVKPITERPENMAGAMPEGNINSSPQTRSSLPGRPGGNNGNGDNGGKAAASSRTINLKR